ncbi:MAG: hypothetical protein H0U70_03395 [Tatlockia sp.]|nr:hypothetical protein [Tatlockia sp.]
MTFNNFLDLWWRNFKGTFWGNRLPELRSWPLGYVYIIHFALLPLTLTIGAFLKTLFDAWTREPILAGEIAGLKSSIESMDDEMLNKVCEELYATKEVTNCIISYDEPVHSVSSNSSKKLLEQLQILDQVVSTKVTTELNKKKEELIITQLTTKLTPNPKEAYKESFIKSTELDEQNKELLESFRNKIQPQLSTEKGKFQRNYLIGYLGDEKNEGKRLQHIIKDSFFYKLNANNSSLAESSRLTLEV